MTKSAKNQLLDVVGAMELRQNADADTVVVRLVAEYKRRIHKAIKTLDAENRKRNRELRRATALCQRSIVYLED